MMSFFYMDFYNSILIHLNHLISLDTTVNSENELPAAIYIKTVMDQHKIPAEIFTPIANRGNIYVQIDGIDSQKILVHTHLDTADFMKGSTNKLIKKDNLFFGRGTLDCKGLIAVWMQVIIDLYSELGKPHKTLAFVAVADEESTGNYGTKWLMEHTDCFQDVLLVIGEGGGYSVEAEDKIYFTFQTGEIEDNYNETASSISNKQREQIVKNAIKKNYYNQNTLEYFQEDSNFENKRCISRESFYLGVQDLIDTIPESNILGNYYAIFEKTLQEFNQDYMLLPVISPGYSDNRFFRRKGIDTIGFFPLDPLNYIGGIHGQYECISKDSIFFSYHYFKNLLKKLIYKIY